MLSLVPGRAGIFARAAIPGHARPAMAKDVSTDFLTTLSHVDMTLHAGFYIAAQANIDRCSNGRDILQGSGVYVLNGDWQHYFVDPATPIKQQDGSFRKITIGEDCGIGNSATVMAGVGMRCITAAGAVVTKPVGDYSIFTGNPAVLIKIMQTSADLLK